MTTLSDVIGTETESNLESVSSFEDYQLHAARSAKPKRSTTTKAPKITPTKIDILQLVWLTTPKESITFKEVSPDIMEQPFDLYMYLFRQSLVYLHEHTRIKHHRQIVALMDPSSDAASTVSISYTAVSQEEIFGYAGSILLMDLYPMNQLEWYWGRRGSILSVDEITAAFKWPRYQEIKNAITCQDSNSLNRSLCTQIKEVYNPSRHLAVDEQLRKFDGSSNRKVVNKSKPAGAGMNAFLLADGVAKIPLWYSTEGIGKSAVANPSGDTTMNKNSMRVLSMVYPYRHYRVNVYIDNLYTTHLLHKEMTKANCTLIGTVRYQFLPTPLKVLFKSFKKIKRTTIDIE